ncbi:MAG TPA: hypothetical protein PKL45_15025, partial [Bacteroidia bacterium]|nr:hypothetical protein [Bacteroidia bacterium]
GISYASGVRSLQFGLHGVQTQGGISVLIGVYNPTRWTYPVPSMFFNVFDANGVYLGSLRSDVLQWIEARGTSVLQAELLPNYLQLGAALQSLALNSGYSALDMNGVLHIANRAIPLEISLQTT